MPYRILSLDGGGICGLFTARLLDNLVARFPAVVANADLIAGTSTGGIIAIALARGVAPAALVDLYARRGAEIFDDSWIDNILDMGTAIGADYNNRRLRKRLVEILGTARLADLGKRVLIPSFDLDSTDASSGVRAWKPKFFHNFKGADSDGSESAVDVALRTSAAPTYFPAYQGYIDGGVVANNPSVAAVAAALDPRNRTGAKFDDLSVLSISTGSDAKYIKGESLDWGWGQWARPMVQIMISGVMGVAHFQCKQLLGDRYRRLDRVFDRPVNLDDVRPPTIQYLQDQADAIPLEPCVQWLRANW